MCLKKSQKLNNKNLGVSQGPGYPLQSFVPNPGTKGFSLLSLTHPFSKETII
jgi:hypothetical protein